MKLRDEGDPHGRSWGRGHRTSQHTGLPVACEDRRRPGGWRGEERGATNDIYSNGNIVAFKSAVFISWRVR